MFGGRGLQFSFLLLAWGCATIQPLSLRLPAEATPAENPPLLVELKAYPGHSKKLTALLPSAWVELPRILRCGGREVYHDLVGRRLRAFVSMPYREPKGYHCELEVGSQHYPLFSLAVEDFSFQQEHLNVAKKHVRLSQQDLARWHREVAMQKRVYASGVPRPYFRQPFIRPLESALTSPYGLKRIFNNSRESWHSGTDFRAAVGEPIPAANRGRVVFVGDLFFNGKTVIIDHGLNIFTMSCHLSEIKVAQGSIVERGAIIGLAGATGRVTGPHLHWGVKVDGQWVSGLPFIAEGI